MIMVRKDGMGVLDSDCLAMAKRTIRRNFKTIPQTIIAAKDCAIWPISQPYWDQLGNGSEIGNA